MGVHYSNGQLIHTEGLRKMIPTILPGTVIENPMDKLAYRPQEKQAELVKAAGLWEWFNGIGELVPAVADWLGYGGAAFGGKTYGMLGLSLLAAYAYPGVQMGFFRRTYAELEGAGSAFQTAHDVFRGVADSHDGDRVWTYGDTGSALYFQHCQYEKDVYDYDSKQFDILFVDQANHFTWFILEYLKTRNRISGDNGLPKPFAVLAANPGNIGHMSYMQLFKLDDIGKWISGEYHEPITVRNPSNQLSLVYFIPAFIKDNKIGVERDPEYEARLRQSNPDLADALITGNWNIFSGMAFRTFDNAVHIIKSSELPKDFRDFPKWRAVDWGFDAPFCCLWFAKDPNIGRIYVYREAYATGLTDAQQAVTITMNTPPDESISITYGDPISFAVKHSRGDIFYTSADEYRNNGVIIYNADNDRIGGKRKIDQLLSPLPDGKPGLLITDNCINLLRTLPKLSRSQTNPEDVALNQEDHAYSALRYGLTNPGMHSKKKDSQQNRPNPWNKVVGI